MSKYEIKLVVYPEDEACETFSVVDVNDTENSLCSLFRLRENGYGAISAPGN